MEWGFFLSLLSIAINNYLLRIDFLTTHFTVVFLESGRQTLDC